jgi:lipid A 3-O-deacylase
MTQGMARGIPLGRFLVWLGLAAGWLAGRAVAADAPLTPNLRYELDYSTGIFWKVGGGATPLSYTLLPQIITLKIPPIHEWPCGDGTLVMRRRFTAFFASGGGFGWMNSKGYQIRGAQGQDFNLNWLIHSGVRYRTSEDWQWSLGLYFQHISNKGLNKVNPGLNALGPTLSLSRLF